MFGGLLSGYAKGGGRRSCARGARPATFLRPASRSHGQDCCERQCLPSGMHPASAVRAWRYSEQSIDRCPAGQPAVRSFYRFLRLEGLIEKNPLKDLQMPKAGKPLPHVLSSAQVKRILLSPDTSTPAGVRDRASVRCYVDRGGLRLRPRDKKRYCFVTLARNSTSCAEISK